MADPGPSSGRLPFIGPHTSNLLSAMFASSAPTQPEPIIALASTNAMAPVPSLAFNRIQVTGPSPQANGVLSVRIDTRIKLLVSFRPGSAIQFLRIPKTPSVHGECPTPAQSLKFSLELKGAGSETVVRDICEKCKERKDQATWDVVDFRAPTTIISIEDGTASIEFFIKCYARHHGKGHFRADAVLRDYQDNVIDRTPLSSLLDISGRGKPATPRRAQKRAVRGVASRHNFAPCTIPVVAPSVNPSAQDPQHLDNGTVQTWITPHLGNPAGEHLQTSSSDQQPSWADTAAGILGATNPFLWYTSSVPVNAPPLSQHAVQPAELRSSSPVLGSFHHVDSLPLESNSNPVVYSGTRTSAPPHGEQIPPVMPCEYASIPSSLGPTSDGPHYGRGINQPSSVPEATSQMLSQNSSGTSQVPNTSPAVLSGQETSAPDISTPSEASRLQAESPVHTRHECVNQITGETLLEEVIPDKGPTTGRIQIILCGERFPAGPLYVLFGDNWARARRHDSRILRCCLPPSAHPGVVNVTLSQTPSKNAPEVGRSIATFEYEESRPESLLSLLKTVYQLVDETTRQKGPTRSFSTVNTYRSPNLNAHTTRSNNQVREEVPTRLEDVNLEDISVHFLCAYSTQPNWRQIVSTCNDYGQTLAHIAVTSGHFRLLQHLIRWQIDLDAVDSTGLTALHYAYLFEQEECAKFLIHSGVDQFILDDLGRSPSDLSPSLEVRIRSVMDIDSDGSADGASPIECDIEMPDEAGKLYAKHFLIQQWVLQGESERWGEAPLSRCQSQETSSPPAPDSAGERVWSATYDRFSSLDVPPPEGHATPVVAEDMDVEALIEIATPPHIAHPPSPISELSPQTQEVNRPSNTGQNPLSHPIPLGGVINTPDPEDPQFYRQIRAFQPLADREPSLVSTTWQGHLRPSDTGNIKEQNDVDDEKLLQRSSSRPESTGVAIPTSPRKRRLQRSPQSARPSASHQRSTPHSQIKSTGAIALENAGWEAWKPGSLHPHDIEPSIGDPAAIDITGAKPTRVNALPFMTRTSRCAVELSELGSSFHNIGSFHHLDSLPLEGNNNPVVYSGSLTSAPPHGEQILPVMSCKNASTPPSLRSTSAEPHCGCSKGQASTVSGVHSQVWSQNPSGTPQALNAPSPVLSDSGCPTSSLDALSNPSTSDEFLAKFGVLGVLPPNEDPFKYAAKMAAREAKAGASSPAPGRAVGTSSTLAPLRSSPLPIANYGPPIPSLVFAAAKASTMDVVPRSPAHLAWSSPLSFPTQPRLNEHNVGGTSPMGVPTSLNQQIGATSSNGNERRQVPKPYQRPTPAARKNRPITYEGNLVRLQQRCRRQGADEGAIVLLGKVFANEVSLKALTRPLTDAEEETKEFGVGTGRVYIAFLETINEGEGVGTYYVCRLCHSAQIWRHHKDVLRHLRRVHFGLADVCNQCDKKFYTKGEITRHPCR